MILFNSNRSLKTPIKSIQKPTNIATYYQHQSIPSLVDSIQVPASAEFSRSYQRNPIWQRPFSTAPVDRRALSAPLRGKREFEKQIQEIEIFGLVPVSMAKQSEQELEPNFSRTAYRHFFWNCSKRHQMKSEEYELVSASSSKKSRYSPFSPFQPLAPLWNKKIWKMDFKQLAFPFHFIPQWTPHLNRMLLPQEMRCCLLLFPLQMNLKLCRAITKFWPVDIPPCGRLYLRGHSWTATTPGERPRYVAFYPDAS